MPPRSGIRAYRATEAKSKYSSAKIQRRVPEERVMGMEVGIYELTRGDATRTRKKALF